MLYSAGLLLILLLDVAGKLLFVRGRAGLIGLPWLTLHSVCGVVEERVLEPLSNLSSGSNKIKVILFDFLPREPTELATMLTLFCGASVDGQVRCQQKTFKLRGGTLVGSNMLHLAVVGLSMRTENELREFCSSWDPKLALVRNDCFTFTQALEEFALSDSDQD